MLPHDEAQEYLHFEHAFKGESVEEFRETAPLMGRSLGHFFASLASVSDILATSSGCMLFSRHTCLRVTLSASMHSA